MHAEITTENNTLPAHVGTMRDRRLPRQPHDRHAKRVRLVSAAICYCALVTIRSPTAMPKAMAVGPRASISCIALSPRRGQLSQSAITGGPHWAPCTCSLFRRAAENGGQRRPWCSRCQRRAKGAFLVVSAGPSLRGHTLANRLCGRRRSHRCLRRGDSC